MSNDDAGLLPGMDRRTVMKGLGFLGLASMASGTVSAEDRRGPARKSRFMVQIEDIQVPGWVRVELPDAQIGVAEYREGDEADQDRQLWGPPEYDDLTMVRGVESASAGNAQVPGPGTPVGTKLYDWFKKAKDGKLTEARKPVTVELYNEAGPQGAPVARWEFEKAWPKEYSPPTLDARARGEIAMESLTLAFYDYSRTSV